MAAYSYDRTVTASSAKDRLLRLIVDKVLAEKNAQALVEAFTDDIIEDYEEENDYDYEPDDRFYKSLGFLTDRDAEAHAQKVYVRVYKRGFPRATDPMASWEWPLRMPAWIHKSVAEAIGEALANRDARDATALRDMAMSRRAGKKYKTKEDALKAGIKDVTRQIASLKQQIKDLSDIASPLGPKAVDAYVKKERAHLANREQLLRDLQQELKDEQSKA